MKIFFSRIILIFSATIALSCSNDDENNWALCDVYYQSEIDSENKTVFTIVASATSSDPISSSYFKIEDNETDSTALKPFESSSQSHLHLPEISEYTESTPTSDEYSFWITFSNGVEFTTTNDLPSSADALTPSTITNVTIETGVVTAEWDEVTGADTYLIVLYKDNILIAISETSNNLTGSITRPEEGWRDNSTVSTGDSVEVGVVAIAYESTTEELLDSKSIVRQTIIWE